MTTEDREHLRLLAVFHYVVAGVAALVACIPLAHAAFGVALMTGALDHGRPEPAGVIFGCLLTVLAGAFVVLGWTYAVCLVLAGRALDRQRQYTFCLVMAAISCVFTPFGTVLGVFTLIVLLRPAVREAFAAGAGGTEELGAGEGVE